jgi:hypothetical protein
MIENLDVPTDVLLHASSSVGAKRHRTTPKTENEVVAVENAENVDPAISVGGEDGEPRWRVVPDFGEPLLARLSSKRFGTAGTSRLPSTEEDDNDGLENAGTRSFERDHDVFDEGEGNDEQQTHSEASQLICPTDRKQSPGKVSARSSFLTYRQPGLLCTP